MPPDTVKPRLASIAEDYITGVVTGHSRIPRDLSTADMPALVVMTGAAQQVQLGGGVIQELRTYSLALLALPWVMGVETEAEEILEPFFRRVALCFWGRPGLHLEDNTDALAGVQDVQVLGDSGVIEIALAAVSYAGTMIELQVEELFLVERGA